MLPIVFQPFHTGGYNGQDDQLLAALRDIATDPRQCSSGWLGHFSLEQMDLLEDIFLPYGQVLWDHLINPLWAELLSLVEEAWLALDSGFMHQDEKRLPLAFLPGTIASQPPMDGDGVAPYEPNFVRAPRSPPPDSARTPTSGTVGLSVIAATGSRRLSSSACNSLPAFAGGIHLLAHVLCLYKRVANPQHHLLRTLLSLCAAQCSIHSLISSHILSLVYFPLSMAAITLPRCASLHPWTRLHGWRFPLL